MASPCELLVPAADCAETMMPGRMVAEEAWRVERKFSRYRQDSVIAGINRSAGREIELDDETADLLDFAGRCYELSDGFFDVTSGILRRVWTFDGSDRVPEPAAIARLLPFVGFDKLRWHRPRLTLPAGMELDLGGIGKEYAVDRAGRMADRGRAIRYGSAAGGASGPRTRRTRHQRRLAPLPAEGRGPLWPHPESAHWLADRRCTALRHGGGQQLHRGRPARDARGIARTQGAGIFGSARGAIPAAVTRTHRRAPARFFTIRYVA